LTWPLSLQQQSRQRKTTSARILVAVMALQTWTTTPQQWAMGQVVEEDRV
jgi:hypothetical protein